MANQKGKKEKEKKLEKNHPHVRQHEHQYRSRYEKERRTTTDPISMEDGLRLSSDLPLQSSNIHLIHDISTPMARSLKVNLYLKASATSPLTHQQRKPDSRRPRKHLATQQSNLVPVARTAAKKCKIADRLVDTRLKGADLYVARLAWKRSQTTQVDPHSRTQQLDDASPASSLNSSLSDLSITDFRPSPPGSLFDELSCSSRTVFPVDPAPQPSTHEPECATSSRPCYRCISCMQSAGIRRVFWTNNDGQWEGGKVRDLVDASELTDTTGTGSTVGMFVTKHEVLMLCRQMGG